MSTPNNYREILRTELERRISVNAAYSLRGFARDLKISPASISLILRGKQGLSPLAAKAVAARLKFEGKQLDVFLASVKASHSRIKSERDSGKRALKKLAQETKVSISTFAELSNWYDFAILEAVRARAKATPATLARALGIGEAVIKTSLERLSKARILKTGKAGWSVLAEIVSVSSGITAYAIRDFHRQILRASEAIEFQSVQERDLSAAIFVTHPRNFAAIQNEIREFRRKLMDKYATTDQGSEVHCIAQQFFRLTRDLDK